MAQQAPAPKLEIFGGYSYLDPHATITGTLPGGLVPVSGCLCAVPKGAGAAVTFNMNRWLGLTADASGHWEPNGTSTADKLTKSNIYTVAAGPKLTYRSGHIAPFAEALFGVQRVSPQLFASDTSFGVLTGGGLDVILGSHVALRVVQADYAFSNHHFGADATVAATDVRGLRLQAGVIFLFGAHAHHAAAMPAPMAAPAVEAEAARAMPAAPTEVAAAVAAPAQVIAEAAVPVSAAPLAPVPVAATKKLCSVSFAHDARRPARVDNEAKACLDDVAMSLQRDYQATLILVGSASDSGHDGETLADKRAINTKAYLVSDKGIDASRVKVYRGSPKGATVETILVELGSSPDLNGDKAVDESAVKPEARNSSRR